MKRVDTANPTTLAIVQNHFFLTQPIGYSEHR